MKALKSTCQRCWWSGPRSETKKTGGITIVDVCPSCRSDDVEVSVIGAEPVVARHVLEERLAS